MNPLFKKCFQTLKIKIANYYLSYYQYSNLLYSIVFQIALDWIDLTHPTTCYLDIFFWSLCS